MKGLSRRGFIIQSGVMATAITLPLALNPLLTKMEMTRIRQFDVIITGGSYSGLAAALTLGRALRTVLIIDNGNPCNRQTPYSHNFITQDGKPPHVITASAKRQVKEYKTVEFHNDSVITGNKNEGGFEVHTRSGRKFSAKKLIFATGIKDIMPGIPGFAQSWGISVLHCPYCHGYEVRDQITGVLGNGNFGYEFAALISNWTKDLALYTNGKSALSAQQTKKLHQHNIPIIEDEIENLEHESGYLKKINFKNGITREIRALYTRPDFVQHCSVPEMIGCVMTEEGYIKVDSAQRTSIPGVFACGDNTTKLRTVANAVAMGTTAGLIVNKELIEEEF